MLWLGMTVTANNCQKGIFCTNATHFKLCVDYGNGSVQLWDKPTACPHNTVCNASQCLEIHPGGSHPPSARRCNVYGFICINNYEYQLCKYDQQGLSFPYGPNYHCPQNTICNETNYYHCQGYAYHTPSYVPVTNGNLSPSTKDECKSKNFVCVDSNTYLLCRDVGDGTFKPYSQQYKCPKTQICHKSFDKPCAVAKSSGNNLYITNFVGVLIPLCSVLLINYI